MRAANTAVRTRPVLRRGSSRRRFDNPPRIEYAAFVRTRWIARVLFTLVAIQLAFGLQVSVADAHVATRTSLTRIP